MSGARRQTRSTDSAWTMAPEQRLLLHNVSWDAYEAIGEALRERPALRLTYDRGNLEIMTTSPEHERYKVLLARLVEVMAEEFDLMIGGLGSMTCKRDDLERGLEPDQCYYLAKFPRIRGRKRLDFTRDPPPDLAIEVEIGRRLGRRVGIYEALGVPELWCFDGKTLRVYRLDVKGEYKEHKRSAILPGFPAREVAHFIRVAETKDDTAMVRAFRSRVREHVAEKEGRD